MAASQAAPGCENGSMDQRATEDLRRLAAQDDELAAREHRLQELDATVRELRERAAALDEFFARLRRSRATRACGDRVSRGEGRQGAARRWPRPKAALAAERDEERRELARRALARAEDHLSVALSRTRARKRRCGPARAGCGRLAAGATAARSARGGAHRRPARARASRVGRSRVDRLGVACARCALRRDPADRSRARAGDPRGERAGVGAARRADVRLDGRAGARARRARDCTGLQVVPGHVSESR